MALLPALNKASGDLIKSSDWNLAMGEIDKKFNIAGGTFTGPLTINDPAQVNGVINFGASVRQMLNLYNADYGVGVQGSTFYCRTNNSFAWYQGGVHNDTQFDPGGGKRLMAINGAGDLVLSGRTNPTGTGPSSCRALVDFNNKLVINFGNDFNLGTVIDSSLTITGSTFYGSAVRQMLNLWDVKYGIGIQAGTLYNRTDDSFAWHKGGSHSDTYCDPGGGTKMMTLNNTGDLTVSGKIQASNFSLAASSGITYGRIGMFFPADTTNYLNLSMDYSATPNPYLFRVGHIVPGGSVGGLFMLASFSSKFRVNQLGNVNVAGSITPNSADYAEFFESENGKEIPVGTSVTIGKEGTVRPVEKGETPIGVITKTPGILGNNPMEWPGKYILDEYGNQIKENFEEEVPVSEEAVKELNELLKDGGKLSVKDKKRLLQRVKGVRPKLSPGFDSEKAFVERTERPEWQIVGLLGQLRLTKGQPVAPGWVKLRDISDKVELWLVK